MYIYTLSYIFDSHLLTCKIISLVKCSVIDVMYFLAFTKCQKQYTVQNRANELRIFNPSDVQYVLMFLPTYHWVVVVTVTPKTIILISKRTGHKHH